MDKGVKVGRKGETGCKFRAQGVGIMVEGGELDHGSLACVQIRIYLLCEQIRKCAMTA